MEPNVLGRSFWTDKEICQNILRAILARAVEDYIQIVREDRLTLLKQHEYNRKYQLSILSNYFDKFLPFQMECMDIDGIKPVLVEKWINKMKLEKHA